MLLFHFSGLSLLLIVVLCSLHITQYFSKTVGRILGNTPMHIYIYIYTHIFFLIAFLFIYLFEFYCVMTVSYSVSSVLWTFRSCLNMTMFDFFRTLRFLRAMK